MPLSQIEETIKKAEKDFRKLLPLEKNNASLDDLNSTDIITHTMSIKGFNKFVENWDSLLNSLDKFWNLLGAYKKSFASDDQIKLLNGFLGSVNKNRTTDDVLIYLDKARNNSQHTLWRHLKMSGTREVFAGKGATIKFLPDSVQVTGSGDSAKQVTIMFKEGAILLTHVKVVENKTEKIYELPSSYFKTKLAPLERAIPQLIGLYGLKYYISVFEEFKSIL